MEALQSFWIVCYWAICAPQLTGPEAEGDVKMKLALIDASTRASLRNEPIFSAKVER